ncbi:MAG: hypothetical protein GY788_01390 [bacterium]|nr:hypothetical protein [bacterium]
MTRLLSVLLSIAVAMAACSADSATSNADPEGPPADATESDADATLGQVSEEIVTAAGWGADQCFDWFVRYLVADAYAWSSEDTHASGENTYPAGAAPLPTTESEELGPDQEEVVEGAWIQTCRDVVVARFGSMEAMMDLARAEFDKQIDPARLEPTTTLATVGSAVQGASE